MASASLTARFVRRSSRSLTSPKVACAHCSGDITASQFSIPLSSLLLRFLLLPRFYHFFTRTLRVRVRTSTRPPPVSTSTPCPYRTQADIPNHSPIRLATIIIGDAHEVLIRAPLRFAEASTTWPGLVVKLHYRLWAR